MAEIINYEELIPQEPPEGLIPWLIRENRLPGEKIVYRAGYVWDPLQERRRRMAVCTCTACGETFCAEWAGDNHKKGFFHPETNMRMNDGNKTVCPCCDAAAEALHVSRFGKGTEYCIAQSFPLTMHVADGKPVLASWKVTRLVDKTGNTRVNWKRYEAYVAVGKNKSVMLVGYERYYCSMKWLNRWRQRAQCIDKYREAEGVFPFDAHLFDGTVLENAKMDVYCALRGCFPVSYMQIYLKHPNVENLIVQGLAALVNELIRENPSSKSYYWQDGVNKDLQYIDWKKSRPHEMLGLGREEYRAFAALKPDMKALKIVHHITQAGQRVPIEALPELKRNWRHDLEAVADDGQPVMKGLRYLQKQKKRYHALPDFTLRDYWKICSDLGEDLNDPEIRWPQNLKRAHDQATDRITARKTEIRTQKFTERRKTLEAFAYASGAFLIRPVRSEEELRREGKRLHHCVASYADRHAEGNTAILLIRRAERPEDAYFTLELDEKTKTVRQNRGLLNCAPPPEVAAFVAEWLAWVRTGKKKKEKEKKKHGTARASGAA